MIEPFATTDKQLAIALITAGCQFAPQADGGPARNVFTPDVLRAIGVLPKIGTGGAYGGASAGVTIQQFEIAALKAHKDGKTGSVRYMIVRDETFYSAIKAWDAMVEEFHDAANQDREPEIPNVSTEDAMRVLYVRRMTEQTRFVNLPFINKPRCSLVKEKSRHVEPMKDGNVELAGNKTTVTGALKEWTPPMTAEDRATLKL